MPKHLNLIEFFGAEIRTENNKQVAYILLELCGGKTLAALMEKY